MQTFKETQCMKPSQLSVQYSDWIYTVYKLHDTSQMRLNYVECFLRTETTEQKTILIQPEYAQILFCYEKE
jgi:hypothetical protein